MPDCVVDIETDGLDATKLHCIVAKDTATKEVYTWAEDECKEFPVWASKYDKLIMHNGINFDGYWLNKLLNMNIPLNKIEDTLIMSQLYNPVREEGHSLKAWGDKLKMPKGDVDSFDYYSPEMLEYCKQDTNITYKLYNVLTEEGKRFSTQSKQLEYKVRAIIDQQERNGFAFNMQKGQTLLATLEDEANELSDTAQEMVPPTKVELKTKTKYIPFNIGSRQQIATVLQDRGWEPKLYTEKGNVIVNDEVLSKIDMDEARMFSRYLLLQKRIAQIRSWIEKCGDEGRVHGKVMTLKTITGRMAHNNPNMAQVPASYSPYGAECRELWTVSNPHTHKLVGTDASGLELRILASYMKDQSFIDEVVNGDVHTANMKMAGLQDRSQAKTFIYALMYGAGPAKIGAVVGGSAKEGQELTNRFLKNMPRLRNLRNQVTEAAESGLIKGLDGRLLHIRNAFSALNTLIQGAGAVVCKQWLVHMMSNVYAQGLDVKLVGSIHDEYQFEVANQDIKRFTEITKYAMTKTTKTLNLNCPLDSEHKVGTTWLQTH